MTGAQRQAVDVAAAAAALGIDPRALVAWSDPVERHLYAAIVERAVQYRQTLDQNVATALSEVIGGR